MADFHKLRVNDIVRETPSSVSLSFDVPSDIKNEFLFIQGQYITLKLSVNDDVTLFGVGGVKEFEFRTLPSDRSTNLSLSNIAFFGGIEYLNFHYL